MHLCMCLCVHVCVHTDVCMYVYICMYLYPCMLVSVYIISVYMCVCTHACVCICVSMCVCVCTCVFVCVCICTYVCVCMLVGCVCMCPCVGIHSLTVAFSFPGSLLFCLWVGCILSAWFSPRRAHRCFNFKLFNVCNVCTWPLLCGCPQWGRLTPGCLRPCCGVQSSCPSALVVPGKRSAAGPSPWGPGPPLPAPFEGGRCFQKGPWGLRGGSGEGEAGPEALPGLPQGPWPWPSSTGPPSHPCRAPSAAPRTPALPSRPRPSLCVRGFWAAAWTGPAWVPRAQSSAPALGSLSPAGRGQALCGILGDWGHGSWLSLQCCPQGGVETKTGQDFEVQCLLPLHLPLGRL